MGRIICLEFIEVDDPGLTWFLVSAWATVLALAYINVLFLMLGLVVGMNLGKATTLYLGASIYALDILFVIGVGSWLLFSYLYSLAVSPAQALARGISLAHFSFPLIKTRTILTIAAMAPLPSEVLRRRRFLHLEFNSNLRLVRQELPIHLAPSWCSGVHHPLVYE